MLVLIEFILANESTLLDPCRLEKNKKILKSFYNCTFAKNLDYKNLKICPATEKATPTRAGKTRVAMKVPSHAK